MSDISLHSVIEQLEHGTVKTLGGAAASEIEAVLKSAQGLARSAVCFFVGEPVDVPVIPELFRLPYPTCWLEFQPESVEWSGGFDRYGVLAVSGENAVKLTSFFRPRGQRVWALLGHHLVDADGNARSWIRDDHPEPVTFDLRWTAAFLSALNCVNVARVEHFPDAKLQKARRRRGRPPLFSFWTLALRAERQQQAQPGAGGTHASPRLHLRRGHTRQYEPGKYCWVQAHVVGNKERGMVHKDYVYVGH